MFQDHFSRVAGRYARHRPAYPDTLFDWLAGQVTRRELAWDCATGNGQAAIGLASRFARVVATDASDAQLRHAAARPNVEYRCAPAEQSGLDPASVDLVTCAQALHWLPRDLFFAEARRVLTPGGLIAVWGYHIPRAENLGIDRAIRRFHDDVVGPYWPPERQLVLDRFATIAFPFAEITAPPFEMWCEWTLEEFASYLGTQSATDRYRQAHPGRDPVPAFVEATIDLWGGLNRPRDVLFPLFVRAGRV